jgi:hypothetical protein
MTTVTMESAITQLKSGVVNVTFRKKDGTTRVMRATLNQSKSGLEIPTIDKVTGDTVTAVDVDKNEWRSFSLARVTQFSPE